VPSDLSRLQPGQAYTVLLNPEAGIIDDIIFYYQGQDNAGEQRVMIVNAATSGKDKAWLLEKLIRSRWNCRISPESPDCGAGTTSSYRPTALVQEDLTQLKPFGHLEATVLTAGFHCPDGLQVKMDLR